MALCDTLSRRYSFMRAVSLFGCGAGLARIVPHGLLAVLLSGSAGCTGQHANIGENAAELSERTGQELRETKPGETVLPTSVSFDDGLSEDELVTLALWNNTGFRAALADLGLSRADLVQAGMLPNPTLSMLFPLGAKPLELTLSYPFQVFWLRPARLASANLDYRQTAQRLVQNGLDLIRDVRWASADLALAEDRLDLAESTVTLNQDIAELAQARLRAGDASELDAENARVEVLQAQERRARFRHDADIASERLRNLAGLGLEHWPQVFEAAPVPAAVAGDPDRLVADALVARPDLRAAELGLESAGQRIGLARAEVFTFTASLNAKEIAQDLLAGPGLDIGIPIFNQNQGGIAQAQARFEKAAHQYMAVRDRIMLDVREAHMRLGQARASYDQWRSRILPPLATSVQAAERAYAAGNVSYLFVLETQRKLFAAQLEAAGSAADLRRARAELERSVGRRLDIQADVSKLDSELGQTSLRISSVLGSAERASPRRGERAAQRIN